MRNLLLLFWALLCLALSGCTDESGPEMVLRKYIEHRFSKNQSLDYLKNLSAGELLDSLNQLDEEGQRLFLDTDKMKLKKLNVTNTSCSDNSCSVGYILTYIDGGEGENSSNAEVEVKKSATLMLIEGTWKITEVTNVKTYLHLGPPLEIN